MRSVRLASIVCVALVRTASAEPEWVSFDGSDPDTRAEIVATAESTSDQTIVECRIPGAWFESRLGDDGVTYMHVRVPGLGAITTLGHPELPAARFALAVPNPDAVVTVGDVEVESQHVFEDVVVWPRTFPALDGGEPGAFQRDDDVYASSADYPPTAGTSNRPVVSMMGSIDGAECAVYPVVWNPESRELVIRSSVRFVVDHPGTAFTRDPVTRDRSLAASACFTNWTAVATYWPTNFTTYTADYLIVHAPEHEDELVPFVSHLKTRGYRVTRLSTPAIGSTCDPIRTAIDGWEAASPPNWDKFCLLVGDFDDIGQCVYGPTEDFGEFYFTDDLYGGEYIMENVYVGRLSVDDGADVASQLAKIMDYTNGGVPGWDRNRALLVAHEDGTPITYEQSQENVRTESYATSPAFWTVYGSDGSTNADLTTSIEAGMGLVLYRGEASRNGWTDWNSLAETYGLADVSTLTNGVKTPVVWSVGSETNYLPSEDGFGEVWMESPAGAVSHYGSNDLTFDEGNRVLNQTLADAVFDHQLPTQGHVVADAEWHMHVGSFEENTWSYLLLGDPSMPIRRDDESFEVIVPTHIELCEIPCILEITVFDELGNPAPDALVSVWKPAGGALVGGGDEVFANRYADADGQVALTVQPATPGTLHYSIRGPSGRVAVGEIPVTDDPVSVPEIGSAAVSLTAHPTVFSTSTLISLGSDLSAATRVHVLDAGGRLVAELQTPTGQSSVRWDGRNRSGAHVAPGLYFARVVGAAATTRLTLVR